jgi:hypothetical protein
MEQKDITVAQAEQLLRPILKAHSFFETLCGRMESAGFSSEDPYFIRVKCAAEKLYDVKVWTFYMTLGSGVGHPARMPK